MMNFPGYTEVVENTVYSREQVATIQDQPVQMRDFLLIDRYTQPSEDDVIAFIRKKANDASAAAALVLPQGMRSKKSGIETVLGALPPVVLNDVRMGDESCLTFLRKETPAPVFAQGENAPMYVYVRQGLVPAEYLQDAAVADDYHRVLSSPSLNSVGFGERLVLRILVEDGALVPKAEMDLLLKHRVHGSRSLAVSRSGYDQQEVAGLVQGIYDGLKSIDSLRDVSAQMVEQMAMVPVMGLYEHVMAAMRAQQSRNPRQ